MGFFTKSITDADLSSLQIKINKLLLDCQDRLDYAKKRADNPQKYELLKKQIFMKYTAEIEKVLKEFQD
jgi:hypothetical protein